ncbi:MAG: phospholipase D-like domain-containing protein [Candidatus Taylorbacteria bacterium]|nr:phospholipase D-like domain-containing protein [Candidatus Taylorbacteria bacterium]
MTNWTLYPDNHQAWNSMLADCAKAEKSIVLEQFIFTADDLGNRLINICAERAKAGVRVRFLWDAAGSFTFWGSGIVEDLRGKGIELVFWKTLIPSYFKMPDIRSWFFRNHRRTLVIDQKIAYTGSICVDDGMKNWRDTNVRLEEDVVLEMESSFDRMWDRTKKIRPLTKQLISKNKEFRYVTNSPGPGHKHIYKEFLHTIRRAKDSIYITTPYFVPTHRLAHALRSVARRGVAVNILLPENSDHYAVDLGARSFFNTLLEAGAHIFLYHGNIIHGKTIVIDGKWSSVGSMNLDSISLLYNFEANIITTDSEFAKTLTSHFERDIKESKEVSLKEWRSRFFIDKIPEILIKLVRKFL